VSVNFAIDAKLLANCIHDARDDLTIQTFSLTAFPLFTKSDDSIVPLGGQCVSVSGQTITIELNRDIKFEDGTSVVAQHYLSAWQEIQSTPSHPLFDIAGILGRLSADGDWQLKFQLRSPHFRQEAFVLLASPFLSPLHPRHRSASAGVYRLLESTERKWTFCANPHNPLWKKNTGILCEQLNALLIENHETAINKFFTGEISLTCDTQFPAGGLEAWSDSDFLFAGQSRIFISILPDTLPLPNELPLWKLLKAEVPLSELSTELGNVVTPFCSSAPETERERVIEEWRTHRRANGQVQLTVAYDDFYPNLEILELVQRRLENYGIELLPLKDDYYSPWRQCHLRLRLWSPQLPTRFGLYLALERGLTLPKHSKLRRKLLEQSLSSNPLQRNPNFPVIDTERDDFSQSLQAATDGIHLFLLRNACLRDSNLNHGQFRPGFIWKRESKAAWPVGEFSQHSSFLLPVSGSCSGFI